MNKLCTMSLRPHRDNDERSTRTTKHSQCTCCPYGYHIDLDFVRYCESLSLDAGLTESDSAAYKRRERRRQRQSMEVLLGLINTSSTPPTTLHKYVRPAQPPIPDRSIRPEKDNSTSFNLEDALQEVVSDFEQTLAANTSQNSNATLPRSFAPSTNNGISSRCKSFGWLERPTLTNDIRINIPTFNANVCRMATSDTIDAMKCPITAPALKTIREQMALSLQRMRDLELQVHSIPTLQDQIAVLKERNRNLVSQLAHYEKEKSEILCPRFVSHHQAATNTNSLPRLRSSSFSDVNSKSPKPKRDASVTCGVITRDIGVGNAPIKSPTSSTCIQTQIEIKKPTIISKTTQTSDGRPPFRYSVGIQCDANDNIALHIAEKRDIGIQAIERKRFTHSAVNVKPQTQEISTSTIVPYHREIGVGTSSVSLSSVLSPMCRSKSFNMGEEHLNLTKRMRSTASQYTLQNTSTKTTQSEVKRFNAASQYELLPAFRLNKSSQSETVKLLTKSTETIQHIPTMIDKTVEANLPLSVSIVPSQLKKPDSPIVSRIPRPSNFGTTPPDMRRLKRQQTYTKIEANDVFVKPDDDRLEQEKENNSPIVCESKPSIMKDSTNEPKSPGLCPAMDISTNYLTPEDSNKQRQKVRPSKEMRAAMKVVNDCLLKTSNKNVGQLKNATNIIQQEWFKISSTVNANPLDIEDYMDCFEEVSNDLLHYIVNMIDNSGNTAMHYAVSHGNFDVVSILLDSKVCNINRPNVAGYTAIMLLSLAEIRSATHSNVIRKLFQLADVNIKAKQHGQTALMLAVSHGRSDMAALLLEAGADVNIQDEDGSTAIMCAAEHGHIDIVKLFLSQPDCDSSIVDVDGSTALKIALEAGHRDIGVLLYAHERMRSGASPYASLNRRKTSRSKPASPKLPRSPMASTPSTPTRL